MTSPIKERPILFNAEMVRAVLAGQKMQTRRAIRQAVGAGDNISFIESELSEHLAPGDEFDGWIMFGDAPTLGYGKADMNEWHEKIRCPFGKAGDRLWVRETHAIADDSGQTGEAVAYRADGDWEKKDGLWQRERVEFGDLLTDLVSKWKPSIFMLRKYSRILLEVVSVRVERVTDISEADSRYEGVTRRTKMRPYIGGPVIDFSEWAKEAFQRLWDSINGKTPSKAWSDNPWVWVVEFKIIEGGSK